MTIQPLTWEWQARCTRVIDGDTLELQIDVGFHAVRTERVRILGVNCPEFYKGTEDERVAGAYAKAYTTQWVSSLDDDWPLRIFTHKTDSFGRYLAKVVRVRDEADLGTDLLFEGHAVPFMT